MGDLMGSGWGVTAGWGQQARQAVSRKPLPRMDGGVRSGPRIGRGGGGQASTLARGATVQADRAREDAERDAAHRASMAARQSQPDLEGPPNPYEGYGGGTENPPGHGGGDKPGVLGGGSMGLKPDMSEYERIQNEYKQVLAKRSPFMAGFMGVPQMHRAEDESFQMRMAMAKEKAYRDASEAAAANTWVDDNGTTESGEIVQVNPATGRTRKKTVEEQYKEEMEGPTQPGMEAPYREAMRQAPVYDPRFPERRLIGKQAIEKEALETTNKRALTAEEIEAKRKAEESIARVHGDESRKTVAASLAGQRALQQEAIEAGKYDPKTQPRPVQFPYDEYRKMLQQEAEGLVDGKWEDQTAEKKQDALKRAEAKVQGFLNPIAAGQPQAAAPAAAPSPNAPKVGDIVDGFRFKGGNPKDKANWAPVSANGRAR